MGDGSLGSDTVSEIMPTVCFSVGILRCSTLMINVYFQLTVIETYPQLIGYDPAVYNYFREQYAILNVRFTIAHCHVGRTHLCGLDLNLTYPQKGIIPSVPPPQTGLARPNKIEALTSRRPSRLVKHLVKALANDNAGNKKRDHLTTRELEVRESRRREWKRDLSGRANGTINPAYGCFLSDELEDYALNFSIPWST